LLHLIEDQRTLMSDIEALLLRKRASPEMGLAPPVQSINRFIEDELERLESYTPPRPQRDDVLPKLNAVFHQSIGAV
jgi:hypothetical protein